MNYFGMPSDMWTLLVKSFRTQLTEIFGYNDESARDITHKAKAKYKEIISGLPDSCASERTPMRPTRNTALWSNQGVWYTLCITLQL